MPLSVCAHFVCVCVSSVFCVCMCVHRYPALAQPRSDDQAGGAESGKQVSQPGYPVDIIQWCSWTAPLHLSSFQYLQKVPMGAPGARCISTHLNGQTAVQTKRKYGMIVRAITSNVLSPLFQIQTMVSSYGWILIERCRCGAGGWTAMGSLVPDKTADNKEEGKRQRRRRWEKKYQKLNKSGISIRAVSIRSSSQT